MSFKRVCSTLLLLTLISCSRSSDPREGRGQVAETPETREAMQQWFREARFGLFIHWGVYSVLGRGEWVMHNEKMTVQQYEQLPRQFNPPEFDPAEWVSLARQAGMRYLTVTSKHHDGFAMWDSDVSDYDIVDRTPYGRDVIKMLADECQRQGLKLFLYHSHLDWHHPDYYPRGVTGQHSGRPQEGDFDLYLDYMDAQIAELASGRYGSIAGFWFDGWWDQKTSAPGGWSTQVDWRLQRTYHLIHKLQPHALIGNNHHVRPFPGEDFQMFEKDLPGHNTTGFSGDAQVGQLPLETCETINQSWGFNSGDRNYKSPRELIHYLVRAAGYDSNFLLNVGPDSSGRIQPEFRDRLLAIGQWLEKNGESIFSTRGGPMPPQEWGVMTQKEDRLFLHILDAEAPQVLSLPQVNDELILEARLLDGSSAIEVDTLQGLRLSVPTQVRSPIDTIVELKMRR